MSELTRAARLGAPGLRVLITGSNRGIGRETARCLLRQGCRVVINGRDRERLAKVESELSAEGYTVGGVAGDISNPADSQRIVEEAVGFLGGLDVLINNAAVAMRGRFEELSPEVVDRVVRTNISGSVMTTVNAMPHLRRRGGSVIFVSSLAGLWGFPLISVYAASKMALTAIAQSMRTELAGSGIHVGVLHVGITQHDADKAIFAVDGADFPLAPRPGAVSQERVARAACRMIRRRRNRMVLTPAGHLLALFVRFAPRLLSIVLRRAGRRVNRIAR